MTTRSEAAPGDGVRATPGTDASVVGLLRSLPARRASSAPEDAAVELLADDRAPGVARRLVRDALLTLGLDDDDLGLVALVVSELVTNVVRHGGERLQLRVVPTATGVRVEVTDHGGGLVQRKPVVETSPSGRGLAIVEALSSSWGVAERLDTKTVWCEIPVGSRGGSDRSDSDRQMIG